MAFPHDDGEGTDPFHKKGDCDPRVRTESGKGTQAQEIGMSRFKSTSCRRPALLRGFSFLPRPSKKHVSDGVAEGESDGRSADAAKKPVRHSFPPIAFGTDGTGSEPVRTKLWQRRDRQAGDGEW